MSYTDVFGGANIYPSDISYSAVTLTTDITLNWPEETSATSNFATSIIDVTASSAGLSIFLPAANKASTGQTVLFNNRGAQTFVVKDSAGTQVVSIAPGLQWQVYISANTTAAGSWVSLQYGASVSQANASALAGTGIIAVGTLLAQSMPVVTFNTNYTAGTVDRARTYNWAATGSGVLTLPDAATLGNNWFINVINSSGGDLNVTPSGTSLIDGLATKLYQPTESSVIVTDGVDYYSLGFGQSVIFVFDYTTIAIPGTGAYTLSGSELNRVVYQFTGILTGNRIVKVPDTVQQYWVDNATTGSYTLTVTSTTGTGVAVNQGARAILYCDGADVVNADTASVSFPISVANGGTGAGTAGGALINLGGTAVGIPIFTAVSEAAAWAVLGVAPAGVVDGGTF
jgi:hypothetical protein